MAGKEKFMSPIEAARASRQIRARMNRVGTLERQKLQRDLDSVIYSASYRRYLELLPHVTPGCARLMDELGGAQS